MGDGSGSSGGGGSPCTLFVVRVGDVGNKAAGWEFGGWLTGSSFLGVTSSDVYMDLNVILPLVLAF